jgi:Polyketide cyclase / dehydrase and lipid transport
MNFSSHIIINAPAEAVWDIIGRQFDRIGEWATAIPASAAVPPDVPGQPTVTAAPVAGRVCDTGIHMLPHATEMIIAYSDSDRTLTHQATGMPAYVGVARNRWAITAVDQQRTQAAFEAVFAPRGIATAQEQRSHRNALMTPKPPGFRRPCDPPGGCGSFSAACSYAAIT